MRRTSRYSPGSGLFFFSFLFYYRQTHYYVNYLPSNVSKMQRGTGLSTPLTTSSMLQLKSAQELVDYLKYFRADNIVNDAEFIRKQLVPNEGPWKVLGQV